MANDRADPWVHIPNACAFQWQGRKMFQDKYMNQLSFGLLRHQEQCHALEDTRVHHLSDGGLWGKRQPLFPPQNLSILL
jgi:hypothetical protein